MPAAAKKAAPAAAPADPVVEPEVTADPGDAGAAPAVSMHLAELCAECGQHPIPEGMTHFSCAHGSWDF